MRRFARILGLAVLGASTMLSTTASAAPAEPPVTIKYKWVKGDVINYRITQDMKMKMTGLPGGQGEGEGTQTQIMMTRMTVKEVAEDAAATVETTFDSIKLETEMPGSPKMSYDSSNKEVVADNPMFKAFGAMVGEKITFVIEPSGKVRSAEGMQKIMEKMAKQMGDEATAAMILEQLKGSFGDDAMRQQFEQSLKILPEKPVNVGDNWKTNTTQALPMMGTLKSDITSTFKGIERIDGRSVARITGVLALTLEPAKDDDKNPMAAMMKTKMTDGKGDSDNLFDMDRGQLHRGTVHTVMPMEMTISSGGKDGDFNIKQNINATVKIERVEPGDIKAPAKDEKPADKPSDKPSDKPAEKKEAPKKETDK